MFGSIIGAIGNLLGGFLGRSSQEKMMEQQIQLQREFAQSGIQWKVADARKAGVHPLYALGAPNISFSPIAVGQDPLAAGISAAGQNVGRAIDASSSQPQRDALFQAQMANLQLQRGRLENDLLRTQIASNIRVVQSQPANPPPMPTTAAGGGVSSQGPSVDVGLLPGTPGNLLADLVKTKQTEIPPVLSSAPHQAPGVVPDVAWSRTPTGYAPNPSAPVKELIEDSPYEYAHFWRVMSSAPPPFPAPPGSQWKWSWDKLEYQLVGKFVPADRPMRSGGW